MTYLRTKDEIVGFCRRNSIAEISTANISEHISEVSNLTPLGYFQAISASGFTTFKQRGGHETPDSQFTAAPEVLDFLVNQKIISDANGDGQYMDSAKKIIKLFGKMKEGKITELFALNTGNYSATYRLERKGAESIDLWF